MYILGSMLTGLIWWPLGLVYLAYSLYSNILYMAWICPYCGHYALGTCAAGFDILSRKRFKPQPGKTFGSEFRRKSWVLYPGWFLPPIAGLYLLVFQFSWVGLALLAIFCVDAFWLLPEVSKNTAKIAKRSIARVIQRTGRSGRVCSRNVSPLTKGWRFRHSFFV